LGFFVCFPFLLCGLKATHIHMWFTQPFNAVTGTNKFIIINRNLAFVFKGHHFVARMAALIQLKIF